jgi:hypothetical protein
VEPAVQALLDRAAIVDCLHRYTRGVHRLDDHLILSAFHDDALDFHVRVGRSPRDFIAWYRDRPQRASAQHFLANPVIGIMGDTAHVESYYLACNRSADLATLSVGAGRYVDRFERRDGEWRIAVRVVISEWNYRQEASSFAPHPASAFSGSRDRSDLSYVPIDELLRALTRA